MFKFDLHITLKHIIIMYETGLCIYEVDLVGNSK